MLLLNMSTGNWIAIFVPIGVVFLGAMGTIIYRQGGLDAIVKDISKKMDRFDEKLDKYLMQPISQSSSPLELNTLGRKIYSRPEIQKFVSKNLNEIISKVKKYKLFSAYQAQEVLFDVVDSYKKGPDRTELENAAFESAQDIDILMKVIALGIRDEVFKHLEYEINDIDGDDPDNNS